MRKLRIDLYQGRQFAISFEHDNELSFALNAGTSRLTKEILAAQGGLQSTELVSWVGSLNYFLEGSKY